MPLVYFYSKTKNKIQFLRSIQKQFGAIVYNVSVVALSTSLDKDIW